MDVVKITKFPEIVTLQTFDCSQLIAIFRKLGQVGLLEFNDVQISDKRRESVAKPMAIKFKYGVLMQSVSTS